MPILGMASKNFAVVLPWLLKHEGGFSDHPADPGGATMQGVTQKVYDAWRKDNGLAQRFVKEIGADEVAAIYKARYWNVISGDALPSGVDYAVFDAAVNSGVTQAAKWLQRAVGAKDDGAIGPKTLATVNAADHAAVIKAVCDQRLAFCQSLKTWPVFGANWGKRIAKVRDQASSLLAKVT